MAANITTDQKNALKQATKVVWDMIDAAIGTGGFQDEADDLMSETGVVALGQESVARIANALTNHKESLGEIRQRGREIFGPILRDMGRSTGSLVVRGNAVDSWPQLFRDLNEDLLGGTPDYFDPREVTFASDPADSAKGIFRRLLVDHNDEPLEGGFHNQTKTIRIDQKPEVNRSIAVIQGAAQDTNHVLDYRAGRVHNIRMPAINDREAPTGITNPYLTPRDLTDAADIAALNGWTQTKTGAPVWKVDRTAANLWRRRTSANRFSGDNTTAVKLVQRIPASVFNDIYHPWLDALVVRLETGWQGTIDITRGKQTQQFTHSDLTNGAYVHLIPDRDKDLYPVNFDEDEASYEIELTNGQNNTESIWIAARLPYDMVTHEGVHYAHYSHADEPEVEDEVTYADTCDFTGKIVDVIAFLYQLIVPGFAHLPTSGTTTVADPA